MKKSHDVLLTSAPRFSQQGQAVYRMGAPRLIDKYPLIINVTVTEDLFLRQWHQFVGVVAGSIGAILVAFALLLKSLKRRERDMAVTEQLKTEAEAASHAKSEFLAMMNHEIRTPLTAIIGFAELLDGDGHGGGRAEAAGIIRRNGEHLLGIINDILDISKIEAGRLALEQLAFSPLDAAHGVDSMMGAPSAAPAPAQLHGRVLLAEDGPDNRKLIGAFLARLGLEYDVVENGAQAVEQVLAGSYDAVLMDVQMPVLDGVGATRVLRAAGFEAPIVALTANLMAEDVRRYLASGCSRCVGKPIDFGALAQCLAELLGQPGAGAAAPLEAAALDGFADIRRAFEDSLAPRLAQLQAMLDGADHDGAAALAHMLKGSAGSFGYPRVTALARQIEEALAQLDEVQRLHQ